MDLKNAPKKYQPNCECRKFPKNIFSQTVGPKNATKLYVNQIMGPKNAIKIEKASEMQQPSCKSKSFGLVL
jgi:hypothetical protein